MERRITFAPGEYYHVYNRGVNKMKTYFTAHDYWRFMFLLYLCNDENPVRFDNLIKNEQGRTLLRMQEKVFTYKRGKTLVDIGAFCLMPNHFHILLHEHTEGGISKFMQKTTTAYSMYLNKSQNRTGPLFSGRFKAEHVASDRYLKYLYAYIHLNPIKILDPHWKENGIRDRKHAREFLHSYAYSSYQAYTEKESPVATIIEPAPFPHYFENGMQFEESVTEWIKQREEWSVNG